MSTFYLSISYPLTPLIYYTKTLWFGVIEQTILNYLTCANFNIETFLHWYCPKEPKITQNGTPLLSRLPYYSKDRKIYIHSLRIYCNNEYNYDTLIHAHRNTSFSISEIVLMIPFIFCYSLFIYLFDVNLPMILHPPFTSSEASKANFPSFTNFLIITVLSSFYFYPYKLVFSCPTNNKISWFHCNKQTRIFPFLPGSYHILLHFFRIICQSQ